MSQPVQGLGGLRWAAMNHAPMTCRYYQCMAVYRLRF